MFLNVGFLAGCVGSFTTSAPTLCEAWKPPSLFIIQQIPSNTKSCPSSTKVPDAPCSIVPAFPQALTGSLSDFCSSLWITGAAPPSGPCTLQSRLFVKAPCWSFHCPSQKMWCPLYWVCSLPRGPAGLDNTAHILATLSAFPVSIPLFHSCPQASPVLSTLFSPTLSVILWSLTQVLSAFWSISLLHTPFLNPFYQPLSQHHLMTYLNAFWGEKENLPPFF